jgi:hypothetical protein
MIRLAALFGVACLAVAACCISAVVKSLPQNSTPAANPDPKRIPDQGPSPFSPARHYYAQFSLN